MPSADPLGLSQGEELNAVLGERAVRIGRSVRMDSHWYIPYHCITESRVCIFCTGDVV